jgi:ABC-type uncharacterized transport system involved in gliding motility auxiliary subunit
MNKKQTVIITTLSLVIFALVLLLSQRVWTRVDLTKYKSWTISPVSKKIASELEDELRITYFVTEKLKELYGFPGEISDLIEEYVNFSHGKISFMSRDPAKAGLEQQLAEIGIPYQEFQVVEKDQASFSNVYTGILIEYQGRQEVLPFVFRLDTLEYEITNRIRALVRDSEKALGILVADTQNSFNGDNQYSGLSQYLTRAGYKVRNINPGDEIPDTLSSLFVISGAESLDEWALYRIDRYIQTGGKVLFAAKSVSVSTNGAFLAEKINDNGLLAMLSSYGVNVEYSLALDASSLSMLAPNPTGQSGLRAVMRYPFFIRVIPEDVNIDHPVTSTFNSLDLYWPNTLNINVPEGIESATLFTTTDSGWEQKDEFVIDPQMSFQWAQDKEKTQGKKILGVSLSGQFNSFFKDKQKPVREGADEILPDMPEKASPSRIIVVGNADFLIGNYDFIFNSFFRRRSLI